MSNSKQIVDAAVHGIQERKGKGITILDLTDVHNAICDYFVICHGSSNTNVEAIAGSVEDEVRKATGERPLHREGADLAEWILMDYFDIVVHVFQKETRDFYNIEELWADAKTIEIADED